MKAEHRKVMLEPVASAKREDGHSQAQRETNRHHIEAQGPNNEAAGRDKSPPLHHQFDVVHELSLPPKDRWWPKAEALGIL